VFWRGIFQLQIGVDSARLADGVRGKIKRCVSFIIHRSRQKVVLAQVECPDRTCGVGPVYGEAICVYQQGVGFQCRRTNCNTQNGVQYCQCQLANCNSPCTFTQEQEDACNHQSCHIFNEWFCECEDHTGLPDCRTSQRRHQHRHQKKHRHQNLRQHQNLRHNAANMWISVARDLAVILSSVVRTLFQDIASSAITRAIALKVLRARVDSALRLQLSST